MLRIEFEQNLAANEQTGPINKEMRNLITSLQSHNQELKGNVTRYRRKSKESQLEIAKLRKDLEDLKRAEQARREHQKKAAAAAAAAVKTEMKAEVKTEVKTEAQEATEVKEEPLAEAEKVV